MAVQLRPYQAAAVDAVLKEFAAGVRRQIVAIPTGGGKTVVAAELARRLRVRTLFLVHRDELAQQALEKFSVVWPEAKAGLVKAASDEVDAHVVVASVQTLLRPERLRRLLAFGPFPLVIADEAHHAASSGHRAVLRGIGMLPEPPDGALLLGLTATPWRSDRVGLDAVFEKISYQVSILSLIRQGYLADVRAYRLETKLDLRKVKVVAGDFDERDLALAVNTPRRNSIVVAGYRKFCQGRKAVAFTVDVQHAKDLAQAFNRAGIRAAPVWGQMPYQERQEILRRFRRGEIQVVANASLLTEGWDEPSVGAVIMARPTKSHGLFAQCVGRGLRPFPGKTDCVVLDLGDIHHDLCHVGSIVGLPPEAVANGERLSRAAAQAELEKPAGYAYAEDLREGVEVVATPADILGRSAFVWKMFSGGQLMLVASPTKRIHLMPQGEQKYRVVLRQKDTPEEVLAEGLDLGYAQGVAEDYVRRERLEGFAAKDAEWRGEPASLKQKAILRGYGVKFPDDITKEQASDLISAAMARARLEDPEAAWRKEPATEKQIRWLRKHRFHPRKGITRGEAADIMQRFFQKKSRGTTDRTT